MFLWLSLLILNFWNGNDCSILIDNVERSIDLDSHKMFMTVKIGLINTQPQPLDAFQLIFKSEICKKIFYLTAQQEDENIEIKPQNSDKNSSFCYYQLKFVKSVQSGEKSNLRVEIIFSGRFMPDPSEVDQNEAHYFLFYDDFYFLSLYEVQAQTSNFRVKKSWIVTHSKDNRIKVGEKGLKIVDNKLKPPFSSEIFYIRLKYPNPLITIEKMRRIIQVSEYGFISVLNRFWIRNDAAKLKSSYSRLQDQNNNDNHALYQWKMNIPPEAFNIYYRDGLGNVSTSSIERESDYVSLVLQPRFPIFGGWRTYYYVSYSLPPRDTLFVTDKGVRQLVLDLLGSPMQDYVIENAIVTVRLPEGANDIKVESDSFDVNNIRKSVEYSYLDFYGRNVLEFELKRVVSEGDSQIKIMYSYSTYFLIIKPLILSTTILLILLTIFFLSRVEKPVLSSVEAKKAEKVADMIGIIQSLGKKIRRLLESRMETINTYKIDKNKSQLTIKTTKISKELNKIELESSGLFNELILIDKNYSDQLSHYKSKISQITELLEQYEDLSKQVVEGKITREVYTKKSRSLEDSIQDSFSTIQNIVKTL